MILFFGKLVLVHGNIQVLIMNVRNVVSFDTNASEGV